MVILKKPEVENCTPYWIEDSEILKTISETRSYYRNATAKDYFTCLFSNILGLS